MSTAIREGTVKGILNEFFKKDSSVQQSQVVENVYQNTHWNSLVYSNPWLKTESLVVKPDQLIVGRGKLGLTLLNAPLDEVKAWVKERINKEVQVGKAKGLLKYFLVENFFEKNKEDEEYYIRIHSERKGDEISFRIYDPNNTEIITQKLFIPLETFPSVETIEKSLLEKIPKKNYEIIGTFLQNLYKAYEELYFTFLELKPFRVHNGKIYILNASAKLDSTAEYLCKERWGEVEYPPPFGREAHPEEGYIAYLDSKSGACLKLKVLNPNGRIWTMIAGGGASIIYADTICEMGGANELANHGEYSGAPSEQQSYEYAKTVISLMTKTKHPDGKVLLIGGGIANFTNVSLTFKGIVTALEESKVKLVEYKISIFVRRAGPNYLEGLQVIRDVAKNLEIPLHVFGPETYMTAIVAMALGNKPLKYEDSNNEMQNSSYLLPGERAIGDEKVFRIALFGIKRLSVDQMAEMNIFDASKSKLFSKSSKAIIWGMQSRAVQGMLDFDYVCRRKEPSVVAMAYPLITGDHKQKFYWGHKEILIPVFKNMVDAFERHPEATILVNFSSIRSAFQSTMDTLEHGKNIKTIAVIAEGIPENLTRRIIKKADEKGVLLIGPSTIGGIKPGAFKIGNTGGMLDNILYTKLYRPGSVAYVSKSGAMTNELNNIISKTSDGVCEGISLGGDRYPGSSFMDFISRFQENPEIKMIVLLGEVGGTQELEVCAALKERRITKPIIAWCIGTCYNELSVDIQFNHAGAYAVCKEETAVFKNKALQEAGAFVPGSFDELGNTIQRVYEDLVKNGVIDLQEEAPPPTVPIDFSRARELGLIRKPASFDEEDVQSFGQPL